MSYTTTLAGMTTKLNNMLQKNNKSMQQNVAKIQYDIENLTDFVVPSDSSDILKFRSNGSVRIAFDGNEFELNKNALGQIAARYDIPTKYAHTLSGTDWGRSLLRQAFYEHKINGKKHRFLIRTVDGTARAILSDRFRRMDSNLIYKSFIESSTNNGAVLYNALHTDTKSHLSSIIPHVYEIETPNNGKVFSLFGAEIRNSDFGGGALEARVSQINLICDNQMTSESIMKQVHLGAKLPESINFSIDTYSLDTKTQASTVRDIISQSLSQETLQKTVNIMKAASKVIIDINQEVKKLPKLGFDKMELEILDSKLKNNLESDGLFGAPTKWKLSQAINSVSNHEEISPSRKKEIDVIAGEYINFKLV